MNSSDFESRSTEFQPLLNSEAAQRKYRAWNSAGTHELDIALSSLADFYGRCNSVQCRRLRSAVHPAASWNLVEYVRRMSIPLLETGDIKWLTRALNIASLENATFDYRDSIVSLVIVRSAAEVASLDSLSEFNKAMSKCDSTMVSTFTNARDHSPKNATTLINAFGPPQLKLKRKAKAN